MARYGFASLKSKCSNSRPGIVCLVMPVTWSADCTIDRLTLAGLIRFTSLFWSAGTSDESSEMNEKVIVESLPGVLQYFGFCLRTRDWFGE